MCPGWGTPPGSVPGSGRLASGAGQPASIQERADALDAGLFPGGPAGFVGRLAKLARLADGPIPSWFGSWLEAEREAHMLRLWSPVLVPGLLQTAGYARALFVAAGLDEEAAQEHVSVRLGRQVILERPYPRMWWCWTSRCCIA